MRELIRSSLDMIVWSTHRSMLYVRHSHSHIERFEVLRSYATVTQPLLRQLRHRSRLKRGIICRLVLLRSISNEPHSDSSTFLIQLFLADTANMSFISPSSPQPDLQKFLLSEDPDDALDTRLRDHITASLWSNEQPHNSAVYFQYFTEECEAWRLSGSAVVLQTYQDFLDMVEHLKQTRKEKRSAPAVLDFFPPLRTTDDEKTPTPSSLEENSTGQRNLSLKRRFTSCDAISASNSIFLTVRLWLMINVGSSSIFTVTPGRSSPEWTEDQSLDDFIDSCFPASEWGPRLSQWPFSLNVYNLERVGGFELVWTDHLADHLYLNEDLGTINIYPHVQVLRGLLQANSPDQALPDRLLVETLQTLALMIPRANRECKTWFEKVHTKYAEKIDHEAGDVVLLHWARSPEKYKYWGQRLITIKMAYDASEPKNLGQWWHDRRRRVEWYTFWVAVLVVFLTILFGLVQSITGVMQVYYAAHSGS